MLEFGDKEGISRGTRNNEQVIHQAASYQVTVYAIFENSLFKKISLNVNVKILSFRVHDLYIMTMCNNSLVPLFPPIHLRK